MARGTSMAAVGVPEVEGLSAVTRTVGGVAGGESVPLRVG